MPSLLPILPFLLATAQAAPPPDAAIAARVDRVLSVAPVIDGHNDLAWELRKAYEGKVEAVDLTRDTANLEKPLQTDIPRLRKGHVGGQFWSLYIPADVTGPEAVQATLDQIDIVQRVVAANPRVFTMAETAADVRKAKSEGRIASLLGIEGGHQFGGRLSVLRQFRELGVLYMTLTHGKSLSWADSATDMPRSGGLSPFGRQVVAEMNRIGMIVDISHVSDATMAAVLAATKAPVIASHSSARAVADRPRNIPDTLLRGIAENGGVVMVNFYPAFLSTAWNEWDNARTAFVKASGLPATPAGPRSTPALVAWEREHPEPRVDVRTVADHVEHIARVAGHDHVGLGADYDGISGTGPVGMKGVDSYPLLFAELARRGWSDTDLAKLAQGNILRVIERVEAVARDTAGLPPIDANDPG
ncbi:membrane dipeptidase [Sphingomonas koreensis]|uniref:dipeptidase n=1 Tax=Sphingomonas koreensis TaxID=93064 RepID=UPI000A06DA6D|nr:dipeptidase [Sphingomonas koreensis]PJI87258.1 membrane dipeptidase [Sphingomonas koreensis]RSU59535.1 membrane dipeptidase [Sphingomonas koreensis]RSU68689.1 membrane dipeptidase [Sphingomonas koreensis]